MIDASRLPDPQIAGIGDTLSGPVVFEAQYWIERLRQETARMVAEGQHEADLARIQESCRACEQTIAQIKTLCELSFRVTL